VGAFDQPAQFVVRNGRVLLCSGYLGEAFPKYNDFPGTRPRNSDRSDCRQAGSETHESLLCRLVVQTWLLAVF
jgi:hypothetical protein